MAFQYEQLWAAWNPWIAIPPYKCPRKVEFVSALLKTPSGKIKRRELREKDKRPKSR